MSEVDFLFFDPSQPVDHLSGNLPHWRQEGTTYFVTFRLADSIPLERLRQWELERNLWIERHPPPHTPEQTSEFWTLFPERFHRWLDAGHGACPLGVPAVSEFMETVLRHFDGDRYVLGEHVVMPNHVHAIVSPVPGVALSDILHSWKSYSAKRINQMTGRSGRLWQHESFDHIVRNPKQLERISAYIRDNPKGSGR
ncbi:MAG TPA: transposase [Candidatus Hydrogenedentes bacterium]|nr:transposase [Candidatus Hydrogenedentota bacterium]